MTQEYISDPNEHTKSHIIRHDLDFNPDLENFLTEEEITRILAMTIFFCSLIFLINTFGW